MKKIFFIFFFSILVTALWAQDVIIKKNGDEMQAKVVEVGTAEIKFKKTDNPDGPVYSIARSEVFMIKYANGAKDVISASNDSPKEKHTTGPLKSYIAVSGGIGMPVGKFGTSNPDDSKSGFAKNGVDFNISYALPLGSVLRAGLKAGEQIHSFDGGSLVSQTDGWSYYLSDVGSITRMYFMAGLSGVIPTEKITLDIHAYLGLASAKYPGYTIYGSEYYSGTAITNTMGSASSSGFVYDAGLGILFPFSDKWSGMINLDFMSSSHEFTAIYTASASSYGYNYLNQSGSISADKTISVFSITAGVGYTIGK